MARHRSGFVLLMAALLPVGWLAAGAPVPGRDQVNVGEPSMGAPGLAERQELIVLTGPSTPVGQKMCTNVDAYEMRSGAVRRLITCGDRVTLSPDGSTAAVGGDHGLGIVDVRTGQQVDTIPLDATVYPVAFSPSGRWLEWASCGPNVAGRCQVVIGSRDGDGTHPLPAPADGGYWGGTQWLVDESHIVVPDGDGWQIGDPDGSDLQPLSDDSLVARYAGSGGGSNAPWAVSPDGNLYAYASGPWAGDGPTVLDLWLSDPEGSDPQNLTNFEPGAQVRAVAWSPDGGTIAYIKGPRGPDGGLDRASGAPNQLWLIEPDGSSRRVAVPDELRSPNASSFGSGTLPIRWSPDGSRLAVEVSRDAVGTTIDTVIVPIDGTTPVVLKDSRRAQWSRDGSSIAFVGSTGLNEGGLGPPISTIEIADADGSNHRVVVVPTGDPDGFWFEWAALD